MRERSTIQICGLNIVANPHPPGIYLKLLNAAAGQATRSRGADSAKISKPRKTDFENYYSGLIFVWTSIDPNGKWLDINTDTELSEEQLKSIVIPNNAKPNYRAFNYLFDNKRHRMYVEIVNEFGESFGPTTALRVFSSLVEGVNAEVSTSVTIIPQEGTVEKILNMKNLRSLDIKLTLPNPDDVDPERRRLLYERLKKMNASSLEQKLQKAPKKTSLKPDSETRDLAVLASENGYVHGQGGWGKNRKQLSTTDIPEKKQVSLEAGDNFAERVLGTNSAF